MKEVSLIVMQRLIKVDGKVRTDTNYPVGFMDTLSIEKTGETYRLLFDTKGRFSLIKIKAEEANEKLARVKSVAVGKKGIPYLTTHDGRTVRYPDPLVKVNDTVKLNISENTITDHIKFEVGNIAIATGGFNHGRIGVISKREKHPGGFDIIHIKDAKGHSFATRIGNVFVIGHGNVPSVTLPRANGVRLSIEEERVERLGKSA